MRRRDVIQGIATTGGIGLGLVMEARGEQRPGTTDISTYDVLYVVEDGERVDVVEDPTWESVKRVETGLDEGQRLVTPDSECAAFCRSNCPCIRCAYGCRNCCNPSENVCTDC